MNINPNSFKVKCLMTPDDIVTHIHKKSLRLSRSATNFLLHQILSLIGMPRLQQILIQSPLPTNPSDHRRNRPVEGEFRRRTHPGPQKNQRFPLSHPQDTDYFLVKWLDWDSCFNTWEPLDNLDCPEKLAEFFAPSSAPKKPRIDNKKWLETLSEMFYANQKIFEYFCCNTRGQLLEKFTTRKFIRKGFEHYMRGKLAYQKISLKRTEIYFRLNSSSSGDVTVENNYDYETISRNFSFVNDSFFSSQLEVFVPEDEYCCSCDDCSRSVLTCPCANYKGSIYAYTVDGLCFSSRGSLIYECGPRCKCYKTCTNRVVQLGRKVDLCLYKTSTGQGWGVKSLSFIKRGTFVTEYVGEIVTDQIAEDRGVLYDLERMSYLFDMDFENNGKPYVIDAKNYGNISRFINHSCNPNIHVLSTWCGSRDRRVYRLSLFARRNIEANEELTFDYFLKANNSDCSSGMRCLCMARKCRKILF